jgi:hypothetical protein
VILRETDWERLGNTDGDVGVARRRLHPESSHDLFIAVRYPLRQRMLALQLDAQTAMEAVRRLRRLPQSHGMGLEFTGLSGGRRELQLYLTDPALQDVFSPLVADISNHAAHASTPLECVIAFVARFKHWLNLLAEVANSGLGPERRRGLFGELWVLRQLITCGLDASLVVEAWTGPLGSDQDFQLELMALEVKTTAARQPQTLTIASERQLDDRGADSLVLAHLSLDERRGGVGTSLNQLADEVRRVVVAGAGPRAQLDQLLATAGYLPHQRDMYDEPRYSLRHDHVYRVEGDFPRITEADLRPGVGDCSYRISNANLEEWLVPPAEVEALLRGSNGKMR